MDGCKIDSSQSISTGNQIDSELASQKRCRFDIRIVFFRGVSAQDEQKNEMLDKYDQSS